jgi:hypothetical protein
MKSAWSKTQVGTDKQVLSTYFLTFNTPRVVTLSCRQLSCSKSNGRYATLLQDSNACKAKSKIQCRGINKKEMGVPQKVKGRLPATTLQLLCVVMLNNGDKVVGVAKFFQLSFRCFILQTYPLHVFRELITLAASRSMDTDGKYEFVITFLSSMEFSLNICQVS